jgi:hypothetical protein
MNCKLVAGSVVLTIVLFANRDWAQVNVQGSSSSVVTDLSANPNSVNDVHNFNNTTPATVVTPTTTSSTEALTFGSTSGNVTASEGLFQGLSTATYANTGQNEYAETVVQATANDLATITSATLPTNTPVTILFSLATSGTLTSPDVIAGGAYEADAFASFQISQQSGPNSLLLRYNSATGFHNTLSGTFAGFVGEQLVLSQTMELSTYVSGEYSNPHPSVSTVDFSDTFQFFGDSSTAGVALVDNSGHTYASPSPPDVRIAQVAGANSAIPGGAGNFTGFQSPSPPGISPQPAISGGNVAFVGAGTGGQQGVYVHSAMPSPPDVKIADLNTAIPGGTGNFASFFTQVGIGGGNVVFIGSGSGGQTGIYAVPSPPGITPSPPGIRIADLNTAIPSGTGNFTGFAQAAPATSGGNVAFIGSGSGGQQGIYLSGTVPTLPQIKIADLNTAIPGGTGNFTGFVGSPAISGQNVAFIGSGSGGQQGVYLSNGQPAPPEIKVADTSTMMPGTSANFQFFTSVSMDTSVVGTDLAFVGGGTVSGQTVKGVYFAQPAPPEIKVADFSTAIPAGASTFTDFGNVAFDPDSSGDHIIAFLGMGTNGQEGIYADVNDVLTKVVDLHDTLDGQTPVSLNLGTNGLDSGELTFAATFAGGAQELFTTTVPEPSTLVLLLLAATALPWCARARQRHAVNGIAIARASAC